MEIGTVINTDVLSATSNLQATLQDYRGKWVIIYFYPKDSTPGCTLEGQDFSKHYDAFQKANTTIFGVSRDSLKSHENFKAKKQFPFELISDSDEKLCEQFNVIKMKSMFGKQVRGIVRSTFVIDPNGKLDKAWHKVKVKGHVDEVLVYVQSKVS